MMENVSSTKITTGLHSRLDDLRTRLLAAQPHDYEAVYDAFITLLEHLMEAEDEKTKHL